MGVAAADSLYGALAAFGVTALANLLIEARTPIGIVGVLFLAYLGIKTLSAPARTDTALTHDIAPATPVAAFGSAFLLTLTNPMTILAFAGIFAGAGLAAEGDLLSAAWMVAGVFSGSALWWLLLTTATSLVRGRITPGVMQWINRASGLLLLIYALLALHGLLT